MQSVWMKTNDNQTRYLQARLREAHQKPRRYLPYL